MEYIKTLAVKRLNESGINSLPVDVFKLRLSGKRVVIQSYVEAYTLLEKLSLSDTCTDRRGFSIRLKNNSFFIFYRVDLSFAERNFVIAHEFGHVALDHNSVEILLGMPEDQSEYDDNAKINTVNKICKYYEKNINVLFSIKQSKSKLSEKTIKHHHDLISTILSSAVEWNIITENVAVRVKKPKVSKVYNPLINDKNAMEN